MATLRTIQNIWRYENQTQNAQEIARQAGGLFDKFVGLVENLDDLGDRLSKTQDSYDGVVNKLSKGRGNLVRRTQLLRDLGANTSKSIPEKHLSVAIDSHDSAGLDAPDVKTPSLEALDSTEVVDESAG